mgnify:CR=1 FL=1
MIHISQRERSIRNRAAYFVEFWGCFLVTLTMYLMNRVTSLLTPFVAGASYFLAVFLAYRISGGYVNAAVTVAMWMKEKDKEHAKYAIYILMQILGGFLAAIVIKCINLELVIPDSAHGSGLVQAIIVVAFLTFLLCLIYLHMRESIKPTADSVVAGTVIGGAFFMVSLALEAGTGGLINPSVAVAVGLAKLIFAIETSNPIYWWILAPFVGAVFSSWFFKKYLERDPLKAPVKRSFLVPD